MADFPPGFLWGAATSSYQIEGARRRGRPRPRPSGTPSATARAVADGSNGDVAVDH